MNEDEETHAQRRIGRNMQWLAWLVFLGLGVAYFGELLDKQRNPNQSLNTVRNVDGMLEIVLKRNKYGHYVSSGTINGQPVTFFVDTGASGVALPQQVADRLGLRRGQPFSTQTANGVATSYAVRLDSVSVGEIRQYDVAASITPGLEMDEVLLGMSFLKNIEFAQRGNTLILRQ